MQLSEMRGTGRVNYTSVLLISKKGCVRYIFASLIFKSKRENLENLENCF